MPDHPGNLHIDELRLMAARMIGSGSLPVAISHRLYAGMGRGLPCGVCGQRIESEQVEYEVPDPRGGGGSICFHLRCHSAWQLECLRRLPPRPAERVESTGEAQSDSIRPTTGTGNSP